jgi:hypothetical protein
MIRRHPEAVFAIYEIKYPPIRRMGSSAAVANLGYWA